MKIIRLAKDVLGLISFFFSKKVRKACLVYRKTEIDICSSKRQDEKLSSKEYKKLRKKRNCDTKIRIERERMTQNPSQDAYLQCAQPISKSQESFLFDRLENNSNTLMFDKIKALIQNVLDKGLDRNEFLYITNLHKEVLPHVTNRAQIQYDDQHSRGYYYYIDFRIDDHRDVVMLVRIESEYEYLEDIVSDPLCGRSKVLRTALADLNSLLNYVDKRYVKECRHQINQTKKELKAILYDVEQEAEKIRDALKE